MNQRWELRLYVAGSTPRSLRAIENLRQMCEELLPDAHEIEVVDLLDQPMLARDDDILAIPTVVRRSPAPRRRVIGDLADRERVVTLLELPTG